MNRTARLLLFLLALVGILVLGALIAVLIMQRQQAAPLPTVAVLPTEPPSATPSVTPTFTPTTTPSPTRTPTATRRPTETPDTTRIAAQQTVTAIVVTNDAVIQAITRTAVAKTQIGPPVSTNTPRPTSTTPPTYTLTPTGTVTSSPTPSGTPTQTPTPTMAATFVPPRLDASACISVVGDSVAAGEAVFEIPQTGFATVRSKPFSQALIEQFAAQNLPIGPIHDRSAGAVGLSSPKHPPYSTSPAYSALMVDKCAYTVILPWVNDLSSGLDAAQAASAHVEALKNLIADLREANPGGAILVLNYFPGAPASFALNGHAPGFTAANVDAFNAALAAACAGDQFPPNVKCMDVNPAFSTVATAYVVGAMGLSEFNAQRTGVISGEDLLNYYATQTPEGTLIGDGVHLSNLGKTLLAFGVIEQIKAWAAPPTP